MTIALALPVPVMALSIVPAPSPAVTDGLVQLAEVSPSYTADVVKDFQALVAECKRYDEVYRTDCLAQRLKEVVQRMPNGEYNTARSILTKAANRLSSLVKSNADPSAEKQASGPNSRLKRKRSYTAIDKAALSSVMKQAQAIIDEAATELLRSYENSDSRYAHYQKMAVAVGSTKVLLRS